MPALLDVRVNKTSLCGGPEKVRVRFPSPDMPKIVRLGGDNVAFTPTVTLVVATASPAACAVIVAVPDEMPLTLGCRRGCV